MERITDSAVTPAEDPRMAETRVPPDTTTCTAAAREHPARTLARAVTLIAVFAVVATSEAATSEAATPPSEVHYGCEAVDLETGAPIANVSIQAREWICLYRCSRFENGQCRDCIPDDVLRTGTDVTDDEGRVHLVFQTPYCEFVSQDPLLWETRTHDSWDDPVIVGGGGADAWVLAWVEDVHDGDLTHRVHLVRESRIIEQFAPVIHRHRGRELQTGLADLVRSVDDHAAIEGYDVLGRRVVDEDPPPLHVYDDHFWCTYGTGTQQPYLRLDFADSVLHDGAPAGQRPLYAHVFSWGDGLVVQYWLWLQGNDLRELPGGVGCHEGDWEHLALYLEHDGSDWVPLQVNLSQHQGGQSIPATDCWWSATNETTYAGLARGHEPGRNHLHVWAAANSHALYNRFDPVYGLRVDIPFLCDVSYDDRVDYNRAEVARGEHSYFAYDRIENVGEFTQVGEAHGESWIWHWTGGAVPYLQFVGEFGAYHCTDIPNCADFCEISGLGYVYGAPQSPLLDSSVHHWNTFELPTGRWGNRPESIEEVVWGQPYLLGDYLGELATCATGWGDVLRLPVPAIWGESAATARFTPISGDVVIHEAGAEGDLPLGLPLDGSYLLEIAQVSGQGEMRLDIETEDGHPLAIDLRVGIVPGDCPDPTDVPEPYVPTTDLAAMDPAKRVRVLGNPSRYGFHVDLGAPPHPWTAWSLHDLGGREVAGGLLDASVREIAWRSPETGRLGQGRYFLRLEGNAGHRAARAVVVVR